MGNWHSSCWAVVPRTLGNLSGRSNDAISRTEAQLDSKCVVDNGDYAVADPGARGVDVQGQSQRSGPSRNWLLANVDDSYGHRHR